MPSFKLALLWSAMAASAVGQVTTGQISGSVRDASRAIVANADVSVVNQDTGAERKTTSSSAGLFVVPDLQPGTYRVAVAQTGFKTFEQSEVHLSSGDRVDVSAVLQLGSVSDKVTVTASAAQVETESGTVGHLIDGSQIVDLQLNGRNLAQLLMLLPGVATGTDQFDSGSMLYGSTNDFYVNGSRSTSNAVMVDGGFNQDSGNIVSMTNNVGVDFVQEVSVKSSSYSAEYGRNAGGQINFVTKGGTQQFHGTLLEFFRNDVMNARNFFAPVKPELRVNNFGWNVGGPILIPGHTRGEKKLFFFVGQEYKRRVDGQTLRATIPDSAERSGIIPGGAVLRYPSNFPDVALRGQPITDASRATAQNPTGANMLPLRYQTANGIAIMKMYDAMSKLGAVYSDTATSNNVTYELPIIDIRREDVARIDYRQSSKNQFTYRLLYDTGSDQTPYETGTIPTFQANRRNRAENMQLSWTRAQSAKTINELAVVSNYLYLERLPIGDQRFPATYGLNIKELFGNETSVYGIPSIAVSGFTTISGARANPRSPVWDFSVRDNYSHIVGRHQLKSGFILIRDRKNERTNLTLTGALTFTTPGSGSIYSTGNAILDVLLGNYYQYNESDKDKINQNRYTQFEGYVADTWKARSNLTIDYGFRYSMMQPPHLIGDVASTFVPSLYDPASAQRVVATGSTAGQLAPGVGKPLNGIAVAGQNGIPDGFYPVQNKVSPRFGFAWDPSKKGTFAIRGGGAIYYDRLPAGDLATAGGNPPFVNTLSLFNGSVDSLNSGNAATFPVSVTSYRPDNVVAPATYNWNFGIQKKIPLELLLDVNYVSTQGRHLLRQVNINAVTPAAQVAAPSANQNALRPYGGYTNIQLWESSAASNYNGLQVGLTRRYKSSVTMSLAYTFSKVLTDAPDKTGFNPQDPTNYRAERSHATFDRNHILVASYTYKLPFLRKRRDWLGQVAGGWELSGITQAQSGQWLTVNFDSPTGTRRTDWLAPVQYLDPRQVQTLVAGNGQATAGNYYFNPTPGVSFKNPPAGKYGNAAPDILRGPGRANWDMALFKVFRVNERASFQFRGEAFNAFNHASFRNPNTDTSSRAYGTISDAGPPRIMQLGLKMLF